MTPGTKFLQAVCWCTLIFGAALLLAPGLARQGFSLLLLGGSAVIDSWPAAARAYITLAHAVLGAVMVGWAAALLMVLRGPGSRPAQRAWRTVAVSVLAWFVPDTAFSLFAGFWQNALLNLGFFVLFALGLWLARAGPDKPA